MVESKANAPIRNDPFADLDSCHDDHHSDPDSEQHWTHPHLVWLEWLFPRLQDQGFYKPHVSLRHRTRRLRELKDGMVKVKFDLGIELRICVRAPTKRDLLKALYNIQGQIDEENLDDCINMEGPTPRWLQMIADELAKPCRHPNCHKHTVGKYQLVDKCYLPVPPVSLLNKTPVASFQGGYDTADCCKLDSERMLTGDITAYGFAVTKDILRHELIQAEQDEFRKQLLQAEELWKQAFIDEMRLLIGIELMPQERRNQFMDAYSDAAEWRHLDRQ